jgi:hypothetical protein
MNEASMTVRLREGDLAWHTVRGELLAADMRAEMYLKGNRAASTLWELLERGATREELAERLVTEFGIEHEHALSDVDSFLEELRVAGLLDG